MSGSYGIGWRRVFFYAALMVLGIAIGSALGSNWRISDWSGPAQALFAFIAIGIAIWVPWHQRQGQIDDAKAGDDALRRVMIVALRQPIGTFLNRCTVFQDRVAERDFGTILPVDVFIRPPEFDQFRLKLHLLGDVGQDINRLIGRQGDVWLLWEAVRYNKVLPDEWFSAAESVLADVTNEACGCIERLDDLAKV